MIKSKRNKKRRKLFKLLVLFIILIIIAFGILKSKNLIFPETSKDVTTTTTKSKTDGDDINNMPNDNISTSKTNEVVKPKVNPATKPSVKPSDSYELNKLKIQLKEMCESNGVWSIYIKDLKSGESLSINNKKMVAASLIKLFIMANTYQEIDSGNMKKTDEISGLLTKMITISHNESSNKLVELLGDGNQKNGMKVVNKFAMSMNFLNTEQQRDMKDSRPVPVPGENYTSVEDCAKLLESIYNNKCIRPELDKEMMNLMLSQKRNTKLPALIPKGIKIAHKTGELGETENDVGIVFGPKTDYIICVMSNEVKNTDEARSRISQISKITYDFLGN